MRPNKAHIPAIVVVGLSVLALHATTLIPDSYAQGTQQTVQLAKVDVLKVSGGFRASKIIGESIVNEANETVGKVDDIIIGTDGKSPYAVLSVGGFLGVGSKLVAVPYEQLKIDEHKMLLSGANKDSLKSLPEFRYAAK